MAEQEGRVIQRREQTRKDMLTALGRLTGKAEEMGAMLFEKAAVEEIPSSLWDEYPRLVLKVRFDPVRLREYIEEDLQGENRYQIPFGPTATEIQEMQGSPASTTKV
jgi:hypothetical protein